MALIKAPGPEMIYIISDSNVRTFCTIQKKFFFPILDLILCSEEIDVTTQQNPFKESKSVLYQAYTVVTRTVFFFFFTFTHLLIMVERKNIYFYSYPPGI